MKVCDTTSKAIHVHPQLVLISRQLPANGALRHSPTHTHPSIPYSLVVTVDWRNERVRRHIEGVAWVDGRSVQLHHLRRSREDRRRRDTRQEQTGHCRKEKIPKCRCFTLTSGSRGAFLPGPPAYKFLFCFFFKSCNFKGKPLFQVNFGLGTPWGQSSTGAPTQILDPPLTLPLSWF